MPFVTNTIIEELYEIFSAAVEGAFGEKYPVEITKSTQGSFGHYQCNSAMKFAKLLSKNPRQVADAIVTKCQENAKASDLILKLEVAGPGFINITLKNDYLEKRASQLLQSAHFGIQARKSERVIIDFSSPNIAKEMHVGHLRSTIIGDAIARTFEFIGCDVLRLNHMGDWGTSFGMLIAYLKQRGSHSIDQLSLSELVTFYKEAKKRFDEDAAFKKSSQAEVVALQSGEEEAKRYWLAICEISRKAYQEIYDLLDIHLIERGESFYNPELPGIVKELEQKGLVTISEGAKCIFLDGHTIPLMIQKSDGGYNYDTTDMAAIKQRVENERGTHLIYVTDAGQATHFQMVFDAAIKAGYVDPAKVRLDHVPFGLVLGQDGKKFRTRSGETEKLIDLLTTATERALAILKERNPDWTEEDQNKTAEALGINAIKYSDLSSHRVSDYHFSYDKMLRFEGNTAAFLMYSYVRVQGIQRKAGKPKVDAKIILEHPSEVALALHLARFSEAIDAMVQELLPNRLTEYLYELAETFNAFFRDCRVEGTKEQDSRLLLTELTGRVLQAGMKLLGLSTVARM
jgi:arginyl-tRNA synthetase